MVFRNGAFEKYSSLGIHGGLVPGPHAYTKIQGCSSHLYKMLQYLHITHAHLPVYFKSLLLLLLLSRFSRVRLCATPQTAAQRAPGSWDSPGKNTGVGCHFLLQCMKVKSESKSLSCVRLLATPWTAAYQPPPSMGFSRQEYWSGVPLPSLQVIARLLIIPNIMSMLCIQLLGQI